jgi:signal transduction histidine kinase
VSTGVQHPTVLSVAHWLDGIRRWATPATGRQEPSLWVTIGRNPSALLNRLSSESLDARLTAGLRLALSLTLLLSAADLWNTAPLPPLIAAAIATYVAYAVVACVAAASRLTIVADRLALYFPADAAVFLLLTALTDADDHSIVYLLLYLFLFLVMTASCTWGHRAGQRLTMFAGALFCVATFERASSLRELEALRALLRLAYLLTLGTMAAKWGAYQYTQFRRLALLRDVGGLANPSLGVTRMIEPLLEQVRTFFSARVCLLITKDSADGGGHVWGADRHQREQISGREGLATELEESFRWLPHDALASYAIQTPLWARLWPLVDPTSHLRGAGDHTDVGSYRRTSVESLLARFGGRSWLTVPVCFGSGRLGRLHIIRERAFDRSDAEFARQVIDRGMVVIENLRLADSLASIAAERERQRLASDIHDSIIQPYIGLQLGLTAVERRLSAGDAEAAHKEVSRLLGLSDAAIEQLRERAGALKSASLAGGEALVPALRRYAAQLAEESGIAVEVMGGETLRCSDRLGAELFQMAVEGLNNIRRHTNATHATIRFLSGEHHVTLQVENRQSTKTRSPAFLPKSISERAALLGGHVTVDRRREGRTIVEVRIPL